MSSSTAPKKTLLFFPEFQPPRLKYTKADRTRAFRSQPVECIPDYLIPGGRRLAPPLLHLGWIIDTDRIVRFVQSKGFNPTISSGKDSVIPNVYDACLQALDIILDEKKGLGIPDDPRIALVFICDGNYVEDPVKHGKINFRLGLTVGNNYEGAIPEKDIDKLGEFMAPGVDYKWFLDRERWCWTRKQQVPQAVKPHAESVSKQINSETATADAGRARKRPRLANSDESDS